MSKQNESLSEFTEVTIAVPWGCVVGRWYGNRNVRPLLAIHGWLDNLGTWNNLIPLLPKHVGVLCIDLPGHGRSSKLPNGTIYHKDDYAYVILKIMETYNWNKVSFLTHSMGAQVSFLFTTLIPQKVDLLICIDMSIWQSDEPKRKISAFRTIIERYIVEDDRLLNYSISEPPSYSKEELQYLYYNGTKYSVELENCHHILERNVMKSQLYPDKYYFSRDGRLKNILHSTLSSSFSQELVKRIQNVPICFIKASKSNHIDEKQMKFFETMRANNSHFEFHKLLGTHHVHLNCAADVAEIVNPFISRHRPPLLNSWTIDNEEQTANSAEMTNQHHHGHDHHHHHHDHHHHDHHQPHHRFNGKSKL